MPIKIQGDLPVKEILEKENIFVMDESQCIPSGHPSYSDTYPESDAIKRRDGASASPFPFQYTTAGGCHLSWQYRAMRRKIHP